MFKTIFKEILFRYVPFILVYAVITFLSSRTVNEIPVDIPDFIPHFIEYFVLSFLFMRIVKNVKGKKLLFSVLFLLLLALLDEVHQIYVPTRIFSIKDIVLDMFGIIAGISLYRSKILNYIK